MEEIFPFEGFSKQGLEFLEALSVNNNREWFNAHKADYQRFVQEPGQRFVGAMGKRLHAISPNIQYDTRTDGRGSLFRIYRDIRFSKDKTPYNTNIKAMFWEGEGKKTHNPGFFIALDPRGAELFVGMWGFPKPWLTTFRQAVVDNELGPDLEAAIARVQSSGSYATGGEHYKRVPSGYESDHPRATLLRYNGLHAHFGAISPDIVRTPELVDVCFDHFANMAPIHHWLVQLGHRLPS